MPSKQPEADLREYIASRLPTEAAKQLNDDTELFHLLDSVDMVRIVAVLEDVFDVMLDDFELVPQNLATIRRLLAVARGKQGGA